VDRSEYRQCACRSRNSPASAGVRNEHAGASAADQEGQVTVLRLLSLGTPIANRPDPARVAEEMAWLDVLSGGRLEMGLVKGAPY
jgi:hypothetical protein